MNLIVYWVSSYQNFKFYVPHGTLRPLTIRLFFNNLIMFHVKHLIGLFLVFVLSSGYSQENLNNNKFKQLNAELPTPNNYRTASGAPGQDYWQQKVDYVMDLTLDEKNNRIYGEEAITYHNNSPHQLEYLWLQLDQNVRAQQSDRHHISQYNIGNQVSEGTLTFLDDSFDGGFKIEEVKNTDGDLKYHINKTMMRVDLPKPLASGETFEFTVKWWYNVNNTNKLGGRSGYEPFDDGNNVYVIAQFFPRLAKYYDRYGWQNKQFLGRGEFTLEFGDYEVNITLPADHLVAATGTLIDSTVLDRKVIQKLRMAKGEFEQPVVIVSEKEAIKKSKKNSSPNTKTWSFKANQVRDFAFATSRRFIWDAMNTRLPNGNTALAMSMYVTEGNCLWSKYSTKAVAHTLKSYSKYTVDYPYPVAWSIDGSMGMEYPMICFNYGRCEDDGTYSERMKYGHIGVIIHEVGHNFFPMIINSDERQWTWMDEGLNTYVQFLTEQSFERNYPSRRGQAYKIVDYMKGDKSNIMPIMTNSESILQFGPNAYAKPATALNILRETVVGRDLFDFAFKTYAQRWKFKTPTPADFFRTIEDASAVDLDWFWRGWFYTTDHVDIALIDVKEKTMIPADPEERYRQELEKRKKAPVDISTIQNKKDIKRTYNEKDPKLNDFYTNYDPDKPDAIDRADYIASMDAMSKEEKELLGKYKYFYEMDFQNVGGLPMPIIFQFNYEDGTDEIVRIPAEIWSKDDSVVRKTYPRNKRVKEVILDPYLETADVDRSNNYYPERKEENRFDVFKNNLKSSKENPMQRSKRASIERS